MNRHFKYFPATPIQRKKGIYVTYVGHSSVPPGSPYPSLEHPDEYYFTWDVGRKLHEWQFFLVEAGEGEIELIGERSKLEGGMAIVLPPGCWHRYRPDPKTGWTTYCVGFSGDLTDRLLNLAGFSKNGEIRHFHNPDSVRTAFAETISGLLAADDRKPLTAATAILKIATSISDSIDSPAPFDSSEKAISNAQTYIAEHQSEKIDFPKLARELGMSYRSFRYRFKKMSELSPLQYQLERRLARGKNLLASSSMSVKDIARTLGFKSTWHFSHFFRKETSQSPTAYRSGI